MKTSLTLTADLRRGDETQVLLKLQGDGILHDDFVAIGRDDKLRADVVDAILKRRMFRPPEEQVKQILEINEAVWKDSEVSEAAIRQLGDPPVCPPSDEHHLFCVTLLRETDDAVVTCAQNWLAAVFVHGGPQTCKREELLFTAKHMRLRTGAVPRPKGFRWAVAELGRVFQDKKIEDVRLELARTTRMGMGQELPLIAALHPAWARRMNGDSIPFVDAPDLEVDFEALGVFGRAPYLCFNREDRQVGLGAGGVCNANLGYGSGFFR